MTTDLEKEREAILADFSNWARNKECSTDGLINVNWSEIYTFVFRARAALAAPAAPQDAREIKEAAQRARLKEQFKNRRQTAATADFDLPAPNDPPQPAGRDAREARHGFKIERFKEGWMIYPPIGDRWIALENTPVGDLVAALTTQGDSHES